MTESTLNNALRTFEIVEANLDKAEKLWDELVKVVPEYIDFNYNDEYESIRRDLSDLVSALPKIDGWRPTVRILSCEEIARRKLEHFEFGLQNEVFEFDHIMSEPMRILREYRHKFNAKRRELVREALMNLIDRVSENVRGLSELLVGIDPSTEPIEDARFEQIRNDVAEIDTLLGSSVPRPERWGDLRRHLRFGLICDLFDIVRGDWPAVAPALQRVMYGENEPIPVGVDDLADIAATKPKGPVATQLRWNTLSAEEFERLIFSLISHEEGYENPKLLMNTNAPDRGRDLSVDRVYKDPLSGIERKHVIIQCKHWLSKSVSLSDISGLKEQVSLWDDPKADILVIATSGRFTADAVAWVEKHNTSHRSPKIEMWPESHLESLLASRPGIVGEFGLR